MMKKSRKGMTLIEIVISIAIYGILALLLVEIMSLVNSTIRATSALNKRLAYESKFADNQVPLAGFDSASANVTVDYGARVGGAYVSAGRVGLDEATVYTANYNRPDGAEVGAQANFRFMVIGRNSFLPSTRPDTPFFVELTVDNAVRSVDNLNNITISGAIIDATYAPDPVNPQIIVGTPVSTYDPDVTHLGFTETASSIVLDPSQIPASGSYTIRIPVNYSTTQRVANVDFNMWGLGNLSGNRYDYTFAHLTLTYTSCNEVTLPDGTPSIDFYDNARFNIYGDGRLTTAADEPEGT